MTEAGLRAIRWEPIANLPESPCFDFALASAEHGKLEVTLIYSEIRGNAARDLVLTFSDVIAFRCYWDGDNVPKYVEKPVCSGLFAGLAWPLRIITHSNWIGGKELSVSRFVAETHNQEAWRHFSILTLQRHLDVAARGAVSGHWITAAPRTR